MLKRLIVVLLSACATLSAAPEAVIFDFGGVMTGQPKRDAVVHFICTTFHLTPDAFEKVNQEKKQAVKSGKTDLEFWLSYAQKNNVQLPKDWAQNFQTTLKDAIGVNPQMYALVDQLKKQGVQVGLLSNIDNRLAKIIKDFGFYEPFNPCLLSCEIGAEKPDPKIYQHLLDQLEISAGNVVFIDDKKENIEAAKKLGFDAILFTSHAELEKALKIRELM